MEGEFWTLKLIVAIDQLPNLEFIFIKSSWNYEANVRISFLSFPSNQVWWVFKLNNRTNAFITVSMSINKLNDFLLFNVPNFHLATLCSYYNKVLIDLEESCWWTIILDDPSKLAASCFQVNIANNCKLLSVVWHAKHRAWALDNTLPLKLYHYVLFTAHGCTY